LSIFDEVMRVKMRSLLVSILLLTMIAVMTIPAQAILPPDIPREDTLIVDQIFRYATPNNFNIWTTAASEATRHAFGYDTLWFIDQQTGEWINSLAAEPPIYNEDYTEMTVNLREGIYWSDGIEFTAEDLVWTVKLLKNNPGMRWAAELALYVQDVVKVNDHAATFHLTKPNPRFHYNFTVRWNGVYMQPKHIWEDVENPMEYTFNPMVSLGAYVPRDTDPTGYWELWELRDDWQQTTSGIITGKPGPKYILTIFYGPNEKKVMAMNNHELDVLMDLDYEAFDALIRRNQYARSWYKDFPWAWTDEADTRVFAINQEVFPYNLPDVRWALTLALDIVEIQTEYVGGVTRVTPIPQPASVFHMEHYHKKYLPWLKEFQLDLGDGEYFAPFDETVPFRIADWARKQGYSIPTDNEAIMNMFGIGWWKYAPEIAEELLARNGFTKDKQGKWLLPDGAPWKISIIAAPDEADAYRIGMGAMDLWEDFGVEVEIETLERNPFYTRQNLGDFDLSTTWGQASGGNANFVADKWPFMYNFHSDFYRPIGESSTNNLMRIKSEVIDDIVDRLGALHPSDPNVPALEEEFFKYWTENMFGIHTLSFKKFITHDEYYWTNFPTSENAYGQPNYWFMGGRFVYPYLEKTGR
jgi:peptide/nickel transport system substrate-binding protein